MNSQQQAPMERLLDFLDRLEDVNLWYRLKHIRDSVLVEVSVPGAKWEIEFFADGHVEVERFVSNGVIGGDEMIDELFRDWSD